MTGREASCVLCGSTGPLRDISHGELVCADSTTCIQAGREATVPCDKWVPQTGKGSAVCNRCGFSVMQHAEMACDYRVEDLQDTWVCVREDGHDLPHRTTRLRATSGREATCPTCGGSGDLGSYYAPVPCGACDASGTVEGREATCGEEFLSSDKKGHPHTLVCELPQGHPGHCGLAMPPPARDTAPRSDK